MHMDSRGQMSNYLCSLGQVINSLNSFGAQVAITCSCDHNLALRLVEWQIQGGGAPAVGVLLSSLVDRRSDAAGLSLSLSLALALALSLLLPLFLSLFIFVRERLISNYVLYEPRLGVLT